MNNPTFTNIFEMYYRLYRAEATVPTSTDDEYTIAISLVNEAISRWANYDGVYWKELFTTALTTVGSGAVTTITSGTTGYAAPDDMREAGGFVKLKDSDGLTKQTYPIIDPQDGQFKDDLGTYCYFTGDPANGFVLHLNPTPDAALDGLDIDYVYYKKPTELATGSDVTECPNSMFLVHRMLANRFRASRNPYYSSALRDAEDALSIMKLDNDSGNWANPWKLADNSGSVWGGSAGGGW